MTDKKPTEKEKSPIDIEKLKNEWYNRGYCQARREIGMTILKELGLERLLDLEKRNED